ncbi:MAG: alanine racemase [Hyphomonadaceae bacterium]|nr:alanine racemase [Hyphomonadaceae bacterium]OUX94759.1 MAG: hypothetical protein CBB77_06795 [Hyphomonas sp. TMED17]CAI8390491.1 MAG: Alanine racemase [Hyphomonas sp. TMED17]
MANLSRRAMLIGGVGAAGAITLMNKPEDRSGPRDEYFLAIQTALKTAGIATPSLIIDRHRLNQNIDTLMQHLPSDMGYRIVAKSLPSLSLIEHIRRRSGSDRIMTFNQPMLSQLSLAMPEASQLLGKPLPVNAARTFFSTLPETASAAGDKIEWLIDTNHRLEQYERLAQDVGRTLKINLELDIGLHRGGFEPDQALSSALQKLAGSEYLEFAGYMGYETHLPAIPTTLGWQDRAKAGAWNKYRQALTLAAAHFDPATIDQLTRNAAGSPTYRYYDTTEIANEISAGSCLVKPTHFDTDLLTPFLPAAFIAAPVIKSMPITRMPGLEFADAPTRAWNPNSSKTIFIYGGHWLADPVDPPGLSYNSTFGRSSNQEMLNGGAALDIAADDFVFLRPHQSEALFMQFGDIAIYEDGEIVDYWPVFPASA